MTREAATTERRAYLCHECGYRLQASISRYPLYCERCRKYRQIPTHPALIFTPRP